MTPIHTPACITAHMGAWLFEEVRFMQTVSFLRQHEFNPQRLAMRDDDDERDPISRFAIDAMPVRDPVSRELMYWQTKDGIAIVELDGPLMKAQSKFGGTSTVAARKAIRAAVASPDVIAIMVHVDSPGGHVAGTMELADEVTAAAKIKPLAVHADDLIASAAYWVGSAAPRLTINAAGEAGSIGTVAVVYDQSKQFEAEGVKVHVVSTGPDKGAFTPGTEITEENLAYLRELVDSANTNFQAAVRRNRHMGAADLAKVSSGRVFSAQQAKDLGLVDGVMPFERALEMLAKEGQAHHRQAQARRLRAELI